jgi:hypothetical protein
MTRLIVIFCIAFVGGCTSTKNIPETKLKDLRNISHDDAVICHLNWIKSTDAKAFAQKSFRPERLGLQCFKEATKNCPGGIDGVTSDMIRSVDIAPVFWWGLTGPITDEKTKAKYTKFMADFNNAILQIIFDGDFDEPMSSDNELALDVLSLSNIYGTWKGTENFRAEIKDEIGDVPYWLFENPTGQVELTIVLSEKSCTISKSGEPAKECIYHHDQKLISVPGGMYGAHYEPGYRIDEVVDDKMSINSTLKNWQKADDYSYTHFEFSNAFLNRVKH